MIDTWNTAILNEGIRNGEISSGSNLPDVSTDDNGKVLTVVQGVWNKSDIPKQNGLKMFSVDLSIGSGTSSSASVVFDNPLPTNEYAIVFENTYSGSGWATYGIRVDTKTANGFSVDIYDTTSHSAFVLKAFIIYNDESVTKKKQKGEKK